MLDCPKKKTNFARFAALIFFVADPSRAHAITIYYGSINLTDTTLGEDLWRYSYLVDDFAFQQSQGFTVVFDLNLYDMLQSPPPAPNGDWDVISIQPDAGLNSNGLFDAMAQVNAPFLGQPFTIEFVWLGTGVPGLQPFTVYYTDFSTITQGQTIAPEPSSAVLFLTAAAGLLWRKRRLG